MSHPHAHRRSMPPVPQSPKPTHPLAFVLRYMDGNCEPCVIVYAPSAKKARGQFGLLDNAERSTVSVERAPEFDQYPNGPTTTDLFIKHSWWFRCGDCGEEMVHHETDPEAVVVDDDRNHPVVRCGKCVHAASAPAPTPVGGSGWQGLPVRAAPTTHNGKFARGVAILYPYVEAAGGDYNVSAQYDQVWFGSDSLPLTAGDRAELLACGWFTGEDSWGFRT